MVTIGIERKMWRKVYVEIQGKHCYLFYNECFFLLVQVVRSSEANLSWQGTWEILLTSAVLTSELERWCLVNYRRTNRDCGMILSIKIRLVNLLRAYGCYFRSSPQSILHCNYVTRILAAWTSQSLPLPPKTFGLTNLINFLVIGSTLHK